MTQEMSSAQSSQPQMEDHSRRYLDGSAAVPDYRPDLPGQSHRDQGPQNASGSTAGNEGNSKPLLESKLPAAPTLSLPKGGGAIRGMGEKFTVNPSNATGSLSIPIRLAPGRSSVQPKLSLNYDSGAGNGEFGLGWRLSGVDAVTRKTSKGLPQYNDHGSDDEADVFLLAGAEDLVPLWKRDQSGNVVMGSDNRLAYDETPVDGYMVRAYAPRIVTVFYRIERWTSLSDRQDVYWRIITPDNITSIFGSSESSRIYDVESAGIGANPRIFSWLQAEMYDCYGNAMTFAYKREDSINVNLAQAHEMNRSSDSRRANLYLKTVRYGNVVPTRDATTWEPVSAFSLPADAATWKYSVVLDYGEHSLENPKPDDAGSWACRVDPFSRYNAGFEVRMYRLCQRILVFHHFEELGTADFVDSSVDLSYAVSPTVTYLVAAEQAGYSSGGAAGSPPLRKSLPPIEFDYSRFPTDDELAKLVVEDVDSESMENLPVGLDGSNFRWVDLDGEGISGILAYFQDSWYYKRNMGVSSGSSSFSLPSSSGPESEDERPKVRFGDLEAVDPGPFLTASGMKMEFGDVTGNGKLDLISHVAGQWGYFERNQDESLGWTEFHPFHEFPILQPDRSMQFVDLTGDGLADILIYDNQVYTWFPSKGSDGYGAPQSVTQSWDETKGPVCVFADGEQSIYLADMSGDGMLDLCRVRNGDCCYWPQLGYGRFGSQVCFDKAPWSDFYNQFDHSRVKITDMDGSGTADIVYITNEGVDIYLNESGNSFSDRKRISLPFISKSSVVDTVDLLGNGTQCLVWSSPLPGDVTNPMRYVDIFHNRKPHLMSRITNNLGDETRIYYAPSTKFYLQDKENGHPWITRLHFPVQCVERVETFDQITRNKFVSSYHYAHGFYDGVEREFRGFARVEKIDSSSFVNPNSPTATNENAPWDTPPVRIVTWYHTGNYFNTKTISALLAQEYFSIPPEQAGQPTELVVLDDTIIPPECIDGVQQMEACRSLKGRTLRIEVYSNDASDKEHVPYSVQETNFTVVSRQPMADAHLHGIYFVHPRETVACSYERILQDPRIAHQMVLEVDAFGNTLKDLHIAYGRQPGQSPLSGPDAAKQETTTVLYGEIDVTNSLDGKQYRIPVPCESRQYEIRGLKSTIRNTRFQYTDILANSFSSILSIQEVPFEDENHTSLPFKRLLRRERTLFKSDNLSGTLPIGQVESLSLPGAYHKLVFTSGLFNKLFQNTNQDGPSQSLLSAADALASQGYVDLEGNGSLWTATARVSYAANPTPVTAAEELAEARGSFFLPKTFIDLFENETSVVYDKYVLFPISSRDAAGNTVSVTMDYRSLQPAKITDANGNIITSNYDAMGMITGVAVMGKPTDNIGDTLDGFEADLPQDKLDSFLANPTPAAAASLLGNATSRILYDQWRAKRAGAPIYTAFISRETHVNFPVPAGGALFQVQFIYSDGFGRVIQTKTRTKPGPLTGQGSDVADRWIGSGWTLFNNKGNPVRKFEPFFDATAAFQSNMMVGVSPILLYDPLDRPVAVIRPDHAVEMTVFGPWHQQAFDANDNVMLSDPRKDPDVGHLFGSLPESELLPSWYDARKSGGMGKAEQDAAAKTIAHNGTPKTSHVDSMGRPFLLITDTGQDKLVTSLDLDVLGNTRVVQDPLSRKVGTFDFDMCQRQIHQVTMDSGPSWDFLDGAGQKSMSWNNRSFRFRLEYDKLRRLKRTWWRDAGSSMEVLTMQTVYGEDFQSGSNDTAQQHNLRGRIWQIFDQSGTVEHVDFDWDGNSTKSRRKLAATYKNVFDVSTGMELEQEEFVVQSSFDVLHRPIRSEGSDGTVTHRVFDQTTLLDLMTVNIKGEQDPQSDPSTWTPIITDVQYNARGQITKTVHGNRTTTIRTYDKQLFRLARLQTTKADGSIVQDLTYTYDPVGNISHIQDAAQRTVFFRNAVVDASNDYAYDALYRLISASGREHLGQTQGRPSAPTAPDGLDSTHKVAGNDAGNGSVMGLYTESYSYDGIGNILSVRHAGSGAQNPGWTRRYSYNELSLLEAGKMSNRLSQTSVGNTIETYRYEGSAGLTGNMTSMAHLPLIRWDFVDRLQATAKQVVQGLPGQVPETTYYVHDWQGQRVRKITESEAGPNSRQTPVKLKERIYLNDYEIFRTYSAGNGTADPGDGTVPPLPPPPTVDLERTTFHAATEHGHVADIHSRTHGNDNGTARQIRFQLSDHLGSASVELDDTAQLISYEEYFPFGSTSYQALANQIDVSKRYRFCGMELDDETGLYFMEARYYAAWLGRWTAADPIFGAGGGPSMHGGGTSSEISSSGSSRAGTKGGGAAGPPARSRLLALLMNLYAYAFNNPVMLTDPSGYIPVTPPPTPAMVQAINVIGQAAGTLGNVLSKVNQRTVEAMIYEAQGGQILKGSGVPFDHAINFGESITGATNAQNTITTQLAKLESMGPDGARAAKGLQASLRPMLEASKNAIRVATDANRIIDLIKRGGFTERMASGPGSALQQGNSIVQELAQKEMSLVPEQIEEAESGLMSGFQQALRQLPATWDAAKQSARDMSSVAGTSIMAYLAAFRQYAAQAGTKFIQRTASFAEEAVPVLESIGSSLLEFGSTLLTVPLFVMPKNLLMYPGGGSSDAA